MTVGEDSVQYRSAKKLCFLAKINLMTSLSHLEALFLDVTSDALNDCSF